MTKSITLRDANQNFAKYVLAAEAGEEFVITRRGEAVAKLSPVSAKRTLTAEQAAAWRRTLARLKKGWHLGDWKIPRDKIYER